ncbi:hypothetical protein [Brevundimonas sp.]|jgi:hypothetical protein|uniref:hypothetical protein n=1 Tax=Brevundimonas sp. TaxID=1871086 RepID=UPI002E168296|nr:hypothetical protein [Brevundimonas sp.]
MTKTLIRRLPPASTRAPYKIRGPRTWALIQDAYLRGVSAPALAARYDVTEHAIRRRMGREGWTRKHAVALEDAAMAEAAAEAAATQQDPMAPEAAARWALTEATRLMRGGQTAAAVDLIRTAETLLDAARRLADGGDVVDDEQILSDLRARIVRLGETSER